MIKRMVSVQNLSCGGSETSILNQLSNIDGVYGVEVNLDTSKVEYLVEDSNVEELVKHKLSDLGYPVVEEESYNASGNLIAG